MTRVASFAGDGPGGSPGRDGSFPAPDSVSELPVFCGKDCGGGACPLLAKVEGDRVVSLRPDPAGGPWIRPCSRGLDLAMETNAPDRIVAPLLRSGPRGSGRFREAGWDEALDLVAGRLAEIHARYGADSVINLSSSGSVGALHDTQALATRFLVLSGGCTMPTGNYSNQAARHVLPIVLGSAWKRSGWDASTMDRSRLIVLLGANILEARLGSEMPARLMDAKRRGVPILAIDPRRTRTVQATGATWILIRPGTDVAFLLAVLHVLFAENLADRAFIAEHGQGFDLLEESVLGRDGRNPPRTPEWAESVCGVPARRIVEFARTYASSPPGLLLRGYSLQRVEDGEDAFRLTVALQVATGNFGVPGGSTGSLNNRLPTPRVGRIPVPPSGGFPSVPISRWPDAILSGVRAAGGDTGTRSGRETPIRAAYSAGGNFLNQGAQTKKAREALERLEFIVCHDFFLTPTARWSDVVLPAATALEKTDIGIPWLGSYLLYKRAATKPRGQARTDYAIFSALAERLGFGPEYTLGRTEAGWIDSFMEESEIADREDFFERGIYRSADGDRTGLSDFSRDPAGNPLDTPSGKVEIAGARFPGTAGLPEAPGWKERPRDDSHPLCLVTPKSAHRTHSQWASIGAVAAKAAHALEIHPLDAAGAGITDGDEVVLGNEAGSTLIRARVTGDIMPGVASLPEGAWYDPGVDGTDRGGSANMLTFSRGTEASAACVMHGMAVRVRGRAVSADGEPPRGISAPGHASSRDDPS